jgi:hypothetical protein
MKAPVQQEWTAGFIKEFHNWTLYSYDYNKHAGTGIFIQETELQWDPNIWVQP